MPLDLSPPPIRFGQGGWGRGDVPGNGNGNAGNSPIRFRQVSDYDPFLDTDSLIAQIPCLVGSSQPSLLVYTVLHKGWISEQTVSVSGVRNVPALLPMSKYGSGLLSGTSNAMPCEVSITDTLMSVCHWSVGMAIQLAVGPLNKRASSKLPPKGGPGSYKTQFLSSGLNGLEVARLPSWTA